MKETWAITVQVTPFEIIGLPDPAAFEWVTLPIIGKYYALRTYVQRVAAALATSGKIGRHNDNTLFTAIVERERGGVEFAFEIIPLSLREVADPSGNPVIATVEWGNSLDETVIGEFEMWVSSRSDLADPYSLYYTVEGMTHWFSLSENAASPNGVNQYGASWDADLDSPPYVLGEQPVKEWRLVPDGVLDGIISRLEMEA